MKHSPAYLRPVSAIVAHSGKWIESVAPEATPTVHVAEAGATEVVFTLIAVLRGHLRMENVFFPKLP